MTVKELRKLLKKFRSSETVFYDLLQGDENATPAPVEEVLLMAVDKHGFLTHKKPTKRSRIVLIS